LCNALGQLCRRSVAPVHYPAGPVVPGAGRGSSPLIRTIPSLDTPSKVEKLPPRMSLPLLPGHSAKGIVGAQSRIERVIESPAGASGPCRFGLAVVRLEIPGYDYLPSGWAVMAETVLLCQFLCQGRRSHQRRLRLSIVRCRFARWNGISESFLQ